MNIRPMRADDVPQVIAIASALAAAPHWPAQVYLNAIDPNLNPRRIALVAEDPPSNLTAFAIAVLLPPQAELETIAVAPPRQRQGIAALLLSALMGYLKQHHVTEVMLEVRASNLPARALYASAGFLENGNRRAYYSDPQEDAILLSRDGF